MPKQTTTPAAETQKHTPGKWFIEENVNHYPFIMADDNNSVAHLFDFRDGSLFYGRTAEETKANARRIVTCVNMHDKLVEALSDVINSNLLSNSIINHPDFLKAKQLLKQAAEQK